MSSNQSIQSPLGRTAKPSNRKIANSSSDSSNVDFPVITAKSDGELIKTQLTWENVKYEVKIGEKTQQILKGVTGCANPGEFLAIMGSSGAGKTSLLNIIANRTKSGPSGTVSGDVKVNGIDVNKFKFTRYCAYITQQDILLPFLTVKESLTYSALMKIPGTRQEIDQRVEKIMNQLMLTRVAGNLVGNHMVKGISGGEKKRTCIAIELISDPQIIILDEPTSGLDSFTADTLIDLLIEQTKIGKTVITTIHQPSSSIFNKFHKLILVSEGQTVYQGKASRSRSYFSKLGYKSPKLVNPADYFMRLLHVTNRYEMTEEEIEVTETTIKAYKSLEYKNEVFPDCDSAQLDISDVQRVNDFSKIMFLFQRTMKNELRNPGEIYIKIMFYVSTGILLDVLFKDLGNQYGDIQNINGVLYFMSINGIMIGNTGASINFPNERPIFYKEHGQGMYGTLSYLMTKMIAEFPVQVFTSMIASILIYFALGLDLTAGKFFIFFLVQLLAQMIGVGLGYLIGAACKTEATASALAPALVAPLMVFGGSFGNLGNMNKAFRWLQYFSGFKYVFEAFAINQYVNWDSDCQTNGKDCDPLGDLTFGDDIGLSLLWLVLYVIIVRVLAYIELRVLVSKSSL